MKRNKEMAGPSYVASLHRFHDKAAIHPRGSGGTLYLTEIEARQLGAALIACADSISTEKFGDSRFGTVEIQPSAAFYEGSPEGMTRKPELDARNQKS